MYTREIKTIMLGLHLTWTDICDMVYVIGRGANLNHKEMHIVQLNFY